MNQSPEFYALQQENIALRQENKRLRQQLIQAQMDRAIRDKALSRHCAAHMDDFFPTPLAPYFICILFHGGKTSGDILPETPPLSAVSKVFSPILAEFGYPLFFETAGTVSCLLNTSLPEQEGCLFQPLIDALAACFPEPAASVSLSHISVSRASSMHEGPRRLYRAAEAVSERRTSSSSPVCSEDEHSAPFPGSLHQVFALEPLFWKQIQQREFFDAATTLEQLTQVSKMEQGSLERTLASVFSRIELVLHTTIPDNGTIPAEDRAFAKLLSDLCQAKTFQEMQDAAYDILATLEDQFYTPSDARNRKMPAIEQYIHDHYTDQDLGATSIAETFKISTSYLSRIFKADKGTGLVDYIHTVRIQAAKKLLGSTDLTLDEIAVQVGFSNRWAFMRVFKQLAGCTPGCYRATAKN